MSSCCSSSLAILAFTTGVTLSAWAGDKIEFSTPTISLTAPTAERDVKELPKSEDFRAPTQPDGLLLGDYGSISPEVVVVSPTKKGSKAFDLTTRERDGRDAESESENVDTSQDPARRTTIEPVDHFYDQKANSFEPGNRFSQRRPEETRGGDNLRSRLETMDAEGRTAYPRDERYGRYGSRGASDSTDDATTSHSFFNHGLNSFEHMQEGQFVPSYEEALMATQQTIQGNLQRASVARDSLNQDVSTSPGGATYNSQFDSNREKTTVPTTAPVRTYRTVDSTSFGQTADVFAPQEPPASPRGQVQSRPAVLPFPKRPGDVLR